MRKVNSRSVASAAQNIAGRCIFVRAKGNFQARCVVVQMGGSGGARKSLDETLFDQIR